MARASAGRRAMGRTLDDGAAGIRMSDARIYAENGRSHFMTRRFDRTEAGDKTHMQSLGAMGHFDYNTPGTCSYEQAFGVLRRCGRLARLRRQSRCPRRTGSCHHADVQDVLKRPPPGGDIPLDGFHSNRIPRPHSPYECVLWMKVPTR